MGHPQPYPPPAVARDTAAQQQRRGVLLPVLGAVAIGICGLVVLGLVGAQVGPVGVLVGAVAALVPVAVVVGAFLWVDRWEPEPPGLLLAAFGWGACVATLSALIINSTAGVLADEILGEGSGDVVSAVGSAPLVEEGMKAAFLFLLVWLRRRDLDGLVDGIVYAGLTAAGFAFTENILYFGRAFAEAGLVAGADGGVLAVFVLRGLLSPFAHPLFTAVTGIGLGIAVTSRRRAVRIGAPIAGFLGSVTLHALWNGSATLGGGLGFLIVYGLIMVPLFVGGVLLVVWQRRREQRVVVAALPGFAGAGWIAPSEVPLLASLAGRRGWRRAVRRQTGSDAAKAVTAYQTTVTALAFLRARMTRGTAGPAAAQWHHEMVTALTSARAQAVARPGALRAALPHPPPGWQPPPTGPPPNWQPPVPPPASPPQWHGAAPPPFAQPPRPPQPSWPAQRPPNAPQPDPAQWPNPGRWPAQPGRPHTPDHSPASYEPRPDNHANDDRRRGDGTPWHDGTQQGHEAQPGAQPGQGAQPGHEDQPGREGRQGQDGRQDQQSWPSGDAQPGQ